MSYQGSGKSYFSVFCDIFLFFYRCAIFFIFFRCAIFFCSSLCFSIDLVQSQAIVTHDPGDWAKILYQCPKDRCLQLFLCFCYSLIWFLQSLCNKLGLAQIRIVILEKLLQIYERPDDKTNIDRAGKITIPQYTNNNAKECYSKTAHN